MRKRDVVPGPEDRPRCTGDEPRCVAVSATWHTDRPTCLRWLKIPFPYYGLTGVADKAACVLAQPLTVRHTTHRHRHRETRVHYNSCPTTAPPSVQPCVLDDASWCALPCRLPLCATSPSCALTCKARRAPSVAGSARSREAARPRLQHWAAAAAARSRAAQH